MQAIIMASRSRNSADSSSAGSSNSSSKRKQQRLSSPPNNKIQTQEQFNKILDRRHDNILSRAQQFSSAVEQATNLQKIALHCLPAGGHRNNNPARPSPNQPEYSFYVPLQTFLEVIKNRPALHAQEQKINRELVEYNKQNVRKTVFESRLNIYFNADAVAYIVDVISREHDQRQKKIKSESPNSSFSYRLLDTERQIPHTTETDIEFAIMRACDAFVFGENWHQPANATEYYQHMRQYVLVPGRLAENVYFLADIFGFVDLKSQCEASVAYCWGHHVRNQLFASLPSLEFLTAKLQFANEAHSAVLRNFLLLLINASGASFVQLLHLYGLALNKCGGDINTALLVERLISSSSMLTILTLEEKLSVMFYSLEKDPIFKSRMLRSVLMRNVDAAALNADECDYMRDTIDLMRKYSKQKVIFVLPKQNISNPKLREKLMPSNLHATSSSASKSKPNSSFFKSPPSKAAENVENQQHTIELELSSTTYDLCCELFLVLSGKTALSPGSSELLWPLNMQFVEIRQIPTTAAGSSSKPNGFSMLDRVTEPIDDDDENVDAVAKWHNMPFLYAPEPISSGLFGVRRPMLLNDPLYAMLSLTLDYPMEHKFQPGLAFELRITAETEAQLFMMKWKWNEGLNIDAAATTSGTTSAAAKSGGNRRRRRPSARKRPNGPVRPRGAVAKPPPPPPAASLPSSRPAMDDESNEAEAMLADDDDDDAAEEEEFVDAVPGNDEEEADDADAEYGEGEATNQQQQVDEEQYDEQQEETEQDGREDEQQEHDDEADERQQQPKWQREPSNDDDDYDDDDDEAGDGDYRSGRAR